MTFTFETLPIANKDILREGILERFERDIAPVSCAFSSRNYIFIFGEGCFPAIIRVSLETPHRKTEDVLSELMWVDDLKNDVANVCQPIPSLGHRLVERISVGDNVYLVTMFRKANGAIFPDVHWDSAYFYNAGVLLGKIHRTSHEGYMRGFRYKRKQWDESPYCNFFAFDDYFSPESRQETENLLERIKSIPQDPRWYGMIHGDFHNGNMFCDWGDLWAFDFDDCCYGYFMFDIVCIAHICIHSPSYAANFPDATARERLLGENGILTHLRAGYTSEYQLPDEQWELFDDFFRLRIVQIMNIQISNQMYSREITLALNEASFAYLQRDKPPIDRMEEVRAESRSRMTPELLAQLTKTVMG